MTAGRETFLEWPYCPPGNYFVTCMYLLAWPYLVEKSLKKSYPRHTVTVKNRYLQGCTVGCLAPGSMLELATGKNVPDVVILDFSANDSEMIDDPGVFFSVSQAYCLGGHHFSSPILFRSDSNCSGDDCSPRIGFKDGRGLHSTTHDSGDHDQVLPPEWCWPSTYAACASAQLRTFHRRSLPSSR